MSKKVLIMGAGPAGLSAAYELVKIGGYDITILELGNQVGGISKTINYKNNRIDIGGHRFFSKSDIVMNWWTNILPLESFNGEAEKNKKIMLIRSRLSRILFLGKFFDYPISLSINTIKNLGLVRLVNIGFSYVKAMILPIKDEKSLEDFLINRFGKKLYQTFFESYTHKVWGVECSEIEPEWGAQRIKGLSISKAILHALKKPFTSKSISQKELETSLIEQFYYPSFGPGQLWEEVANIIKKDVNFMFKHKVNNLNFDKNGLSSISVTNIQNNQELILQADFYISTLPISNLFNSTDKYVPSEVKSIASNLQYRDFITVGILMNKSNKKNLQDNWIYIQEEDVKVGRLQIFNNWSPYLVDDKDKVWMGMEYFCQEDDDFWSLDDDKLIEFAKNELIKLDFLDEQEFCDAVVIRIPKAYPAYFGVYDKFDKVQEFLDKQDNIFPIGRNGMHRYNNMDHSMLAAFEAVKQIDSGIIDKEKLWSVNSEKEYHESK